MTKIRQPIITVCGHVDHGKTSLLDALRGSSVQSGEAGGITQKISFTKYPVEQLHKVCPMIKEKGIETKIPGFLFIDTPGHAAFTNLRKRGGSLADLAIVVVDIKEGIKPQTAEVLSILKANKTPFIVALNKVDTLSGWVKKKTIRESIEAMPTHVKEQFDTLLMTFQGSLQSHGFDSGLFYEMSDFTKSVVIVPCSARSKQGVEEILFMIAGLCQKFLAKNLVLNEDSKGVILEVKKDRTIEYVEAIIYDGVLNEGDELVVASFGEPIVTKVRSLEEILPLSSKYVSAKEIVAATGVRMQLTNREGILPGMPFQEVKGNISEIKNSFKKELSGALQLDKTGIIIKADSLGSLEALLTLLKQANISVLKAGIGKVSKTDVISGKTNLEINPLDAVVLGFNVSVDEDAVAGKVKIFTDEVVYKLIDNVTEWREKRAKEIERERMMGLATICKLEILPQYVFRNSNPAIFGVRVVAGKLRNGLPLFDETGEEIARVKAIQADKVSVEEASEGMEIAMSLPGTTFDRQLKSRKFLYSQLSESQFKEFKKNKDLLSSGELKVLQEVMDIKRRKKSDWGA